MNLSHPRPIFLMLATAALSLSCSSDDPSTMGGIDPLTNTPGAAGGAAAGAGGVAAGGTGGAASGTTGGSASGTAGGTGSAAGTAGASPAGGAITAIAMEQKPCEKKVRTAGKTIPDFMIVLDRSGSMRPTCLVEIPFLGQSTAPECTMQGVDCLMADKDTVVCGGTKPSKIDRWGPAVAAIKSLTMMFQTKVNFGLTVFPGEGGGGGGPGGVSCTPGKQYVPVGLNSADPIAKTLDGLPPTGATPTATTLDAVLTQIKAKQTDPDTQLPPQYVLLVTDGAPTCLNGMFSPNSPQPHQDTIRAVDALAKAGVKTYVIGYDASVDANLAKQLTDYAQHGGTNNFYAVQDGPSLVQQFTAITGVVAECSYQLDKKPDDNKFVLVELDGKKLDLGDANGWTIDDRNVTIQGDACTTLRDGAKAHTLAVTVECVPQVLM